jgi:long-chain acyl-CoA synthetase
VNLAAIVEGHPAAAAALIAEGGTTTYGELRRRVGAARGGLVGWGVRPGDRVAVVAGNVVDFVVAHLAVLGVGAVSVPLNPLAPAPAVAHELRDTGASVVLLGADAPSPEELQRSELPDPLRIASLGDEAWQALLAGEPVPIVDRGPGDVAVLLFTSGTVGAPRPAMLTHTNLLSNLEQVAAVAERRPVPGDVALGVLPMFHVFGLNVVLHLALLTGTAVVLCPRFDPARDLQTIGEQRITHVAGAPAMWSAWLDLPDAPADAFATVRVATSGAAKLPVEVAEGFERRFGVHLGEGYGLTETSPVVTSSTGTDAPPGSIGAPVPGVEVRIVDVDGEPALQHDPGELWVRGPNVFAGYWGDPDATAQVLTPDGWLRTGDIAVVDEAGHLFLVDRAKELILVSGFNVFPAEVEDVLLDHPAVEAAAVVGVPDPSTGEAVKAWVVPTAGVGIDELELHELCRSRLARYKCPSSVSVVEELPRGLTGKVLRRALR